MNDKVVITVDIDDELYALIEEAAKENNMTVDEFASAAVEDYVSFLMLQEGNL